MASNYPPGVTGNEPQITGDYLCCHCDHDEDDHEPTPPYSCRICSCAGFLEDELEVGHE